MGGNQSNLKENTNGISTSKTTSNTVTSRTINNNNTISIDNSINAVENNNDNNNTIITNGEQKQLNVEKCLYDKEEIKQDKYEEDEEEDIWYSTINNQLNTDNKMDNQNLNNNNTTISDDLTDNTIINVEQSTDNTIIEKFISEYSINNNNNNQEQQQTSSSSSSSSQTIINDNNLSDNQLNLNLFKFNLNKKREERHLAIDLLKKKLNKINMEMLNERYDKELLLNIIKENNINISDKKFLTTFNIENCINNENNLENTPNNNIVINENDNTMDVTENSIDNIMDVTENSIDNTIDITENQIDNSINITENPLDNGDNNLKLKKQIAHLSLSLQLSNAECLTLTNELSVVQKQVESLKDVIKISKEMVEIREQQINQLKCKLNEIEESLGERELKLMSDNLRKEYDKQLTNIRNLRTLYEERARVCAIERENMMRQIAEQKQQLENELEKNKNLTEHTDNLQDELETSNTELTNIKQEFTITKSEQQELQDEMLIINKMFSQMLIGFSSNNKCLNIDRLTQVLEENRDLINDMTISEISTGGASALPKLLLDLVKQAEETAQVGKLNEECCPNVVDINNVVTVSNDLTKLEENPTGSSVSSTEEIILNLPKVWRILIELLGHHKEVNQVPFIENGEAEDCYKSVQTPNGTELVLSVSKTFIKLKDLILEKKSLQKETTRLKTLNGHLERRLNTQEKRLGAVSLELTKTWHLVSRMQRQHRQLHTNEQILRYQLQQKRRLLNELKDELEYCRKKWTMAREKNNETEIQWKHLQKEFAGRKLNDLKANNNNNNDNNKTENGNCSKNNFDETNMINNSAESGYSGDEQISDDSDNDNEKKKLINIEINTNTNNIIDEIFLQNDLQIQPAPVYTATTTILPQLQQAAVVIVENSLEHINCNKTLNSNKKPINKILGARPKLLKGSNNNCSSNSSSSSSSSSSSTSSSNSSFSSGTNNAVKLSTEVKKLSKINSSHKVMGGKNIGKNGNKYEETLEEMFLRLSGVMVINEEETQNIDNNDVPDEDADADADDDDTDNSDTNEYIPFNKNLPSTSNMIIMEQSTKQSQLELDEEIKNNKPINVVVEPLSVCLIKENDKKTILTMTEQEYTERRAARLKRLEDECNQLMSKMTKNLTRGNVISEQIDDLRIRCANNNNNNNNNNTLNNNITQNNQNNNNLIESRAVNNDENHNDIVQLNDNQMENITINNNNDVLVEEDDNNNNNNSNNNTNNN